MKDPFAPDLLAGKCALVTGGGTGLGLAMTRRFLSLGAEAIICGRRETVLAEAKASLEAEFGPRIRTQTCDVRDPAAVVALMDVAFAGRPPDILVNNAAANFVARTETLSPRAFDAVIDISMKGAFHCTLEVGKRWLAAGTSATVLSILTSYSWHGSPYVAPSAMAKAGLLAMTRSLATEWGPKGIRFVAISPGAFPTKGAWERLAPRPDLADIHERQNSLGRPGEARELADLAAFLVSDAAGYFHGDCVIIDGGRWLKGAGTFGYLASLSEAEWETMKPPRKDAS